MTSIFISVTAPLEWLSQPWHWSISGVAIAGILFLMTWMGRSFGISSSLKTFCHIAGAGKRFSYFDLNLKDEYWRIAFVIGIMAGGFLSATFLSNPDSVAISQSTMEHLANWGIASTGNGFVPDQLFNFITLQGLLLTILGGFLVGFGARYADGCTSGHAITGLAHLQIPSLLTVVGFFIGGLIMTWGIMPWLFG